MTEQAGWVLVHSPRQWEAGDHLPQCQANTKLKDARNRGKETFDWAWVGPSMRADTTPHTILFSWRGVVFGEGSATIAQATAKMKRDGYTFKFVVSGYRHLERPVLIDSFCPRRPSGGLLRLSPDEHRMYISRKAKAKAR